MSTEIAKQTVKRRMRNFLRNDIGAIGQMMALTALPLFAAAGVAIDTARLAREETAFHAAVDSAVLAVASDDRSAIGNQSTTQQTASINTLTTFAQQYIAANYSPSTGAANDITVSLAISNQEITMTATHAVPPALMNLFGIGNTTLSSTSTVKKAMRPVEVTLVMDTTGSMATNNKITGAKTAAKSLLNTLYGGSLSQIPYSEYIRVSLVPFAAAVRLDQNATDFNLGWIDTTGANPLSKLNFNSSTWNNFTAWSQLKASGSTSPMAWNGCVEARSATGSLNENDTPPTGGDTLFPAYFSPDTPIASNGYSSQYGYDYISGNTSGSLSGENVGITTTQAKDWTDAGRLFVQKNEKKYVNKTIAGESLSSIGHSTNDI
jgi:Flp pilus assembly protein TadG